MGFLLDLLNNDLLDIGSLLLDSLRINTVCVRLILVIGSNGRVLTSQFSDGGEVRSDGPSLIIFTDFDLLVNLLNYDLHEHVLNVCMGLICGILVIGIDEI